MPCYFSPFSSKMPCFCLISFNSDSIFTSSSMPSNIVSLMISIDSDMFFISFVIVLCNCVLPFICTMWGKFPPCRPLKTLSGFQQSHPPQIGYECFPQERSLLEWTGKNGQYEQIETVKSRIHSYPAGGAGGLFVVVPCSGTTKSTPPFSPYGRLVPPFFRLSKQPTQRTADKCPSFRPCLPPPILITQTIGQLLTALFSATAVGLSVAE